MRVNIWQLIYYTFMPPKYTKIKNIETRLNEIDIEMKVPMPNQETYYVLFNEKCWLLSSLRRLKNN
jgi:hypothetical protein